MKNIFRFFARSILPALLLCLIISCKNEITVKFLDDGNTALYINCDFEKNSRIYSMMKEFGVDFENLDSENLKAAFDENGFCKTHISKIEDSGIALSTILLQTSENAEDFFKKKNDKNNGISLSPDSLLNFYNQSDEQIQAIFDIFMPPVLSDDSENKNMNVSEYEELIASVYGQEIADEISKSTVRICVKDSAGNQKARLITLSKLFTLKSSFDILLD